MASRFVATASMLWPIAALRFILREESVEVNQKYATDLQLLTRRPGTCSDFAHWSHTGVSGRGAADGCGNGQCAPAAASADRSDFEAPSGPEMRALRLGGFAHRAALPAETAYAPDRQMHIPLSGAAERTARRSLRRQVTRFKLQRPRVGVDGGLACFALSFELTVYRMSHGHPLSKDKLPSGGY